MELTRKEISTISGDVRREKDELVVERIRLENDLERYGEFRDGMEDDLRVVAASIRKREEILEKLSKKLENSYK